MKVTFLALLLLYSTLEYSYGCTEFIIRCKDTSKSIIIGRTMEFAFEFPYHIVTAPSGESYTAEMFPSDSSCINSGRLTWKSKSDQIYLVPFQEDLPKDYLWVDGQNSKGLSVGNLYFDGYAQYPKPSEIPKEKCGNAISHLEVEKYIQTQFDTVQELRESLNNDEFPFVWGQSLKVPMPPDFDSYIDLIFPMHWSIIDRSGDAIVLEYTKEGRRVHNNTVGVFTNNPTYDWHQTNLNSYINIQKNAHPEKEYTSADGKRSITVKPFGAGSGLLGVPGDFTPPGRFIRTAAMVQFSGPAPNANSAAIQAWHIINSVDITKGTSPPDATGWSVVKDLTNNIMYYRGYNFIGIRKIDLNKASKSKRTYITLEDTFDASVDDVTERMETYPPPKVEL